jgi:hypothetical protein
MIKVGNWDIRFGAMAQAPLPGGSMVSERRGYNSNNDGRE